MILRIDPSPDVRAGQTPGDPPTMNGETGRWNELDNPKGHPGTQR